MDAIVWLIGGMFGISMVLLYHVVRTLFGAIPQEDRGYMDPLPPLVRLLWPPVLFLEYHVTSRMDSGRLERMNHRLNLSGISFLMSAEQFYALKMVSVFVFFLLMALVQLMLGKLMLNYWAFAMVLGFFYPDLWLSDARKRRYKLVQKAMPMFLDFITMAVEAGLNLTGALNQVVQKGPPGPLKQEFFMVVRDLRSGLPRADALRRMEDRLRMAEISSFVGTVIQAEKMGASLGKALRSQAEQRRTERFQRAEKQAMEAPVKLIGPLMMFIFPVTFIVIGFPIVMKFLSSGAF